ncbi:MAG: hypothetical protein GF307_07220 [candidate division Zixibacteria bacterium]|nr:hypothetical protein [candidate division Zixibacteria bacterium]
MKMVFIPLPGGGPYKPEVLRPPLYPLIIGFIHNLLSLPVEFILFLQFVVSLLIPWITCKLGSIVFDNNTGYIAAILVLFEGSIITHSFLLLTELFFTGTVLLSVYYMILFIKRGNFPLLILSILFWAFSCYLRIASLYLGPILIVSLFFIKEKPIRYKIKTASLATLMVILCVAPWIARNYFKYDIPAFSTGSSLVLYLHKTASIESFISDVSVEEAQNILIDRAIIETGNSDFQAVFRPYQRKINDYFIQQSIHYFKEYPLYLFYIETKGAVRLMLSPGNGTMAGLLGINDISEGQLIKMPLTGFKNPESFVLFLFFVYQLIFLLLFNAGLITGLIKRHFNKPELLIILLSAGYLMLAAADLTAHSRFRIPILPLLSILSAHGLYYIYFKIKPNLIKLQAGNASAD